MQHTSNSCPDSQIQITMFGEFAIRAGEKEIKDTTARTHQLWHLLEYLIAYRHKAITQKELIEVLWPEGGIDNPANALKNLVYRVRSTLGNHGIPCAKEMIVYNRGGYRLNNNLNYVVDSEEFSRVCQLARTAEPGSDQQIKLLTEATRIYKGDYLPGARFETWVVPLSSQYRSQYFQCVYALLEILQGQHRYAEMESICEKATQNDPFEEAAHRYYILSLIRQGKQSKAMGHYSRVTDLFFRELGVSPSAAMRSLYREIAKATHDVEIDLGIVKEDLEESDRTEGAFYCEYEVFKNMYRLEARTAARTGQSVYIGLITVEDADGNGLDVKLQNKMMDSLYDIIQNSLRKGDVFARFSACQYVLMVSTVTFENCSVVMERIIKRFRNLHRNRSVSVFAKIQPLDPIGAA